MLNMEIYKILQNLLLATVFYVQRAIANVASVIFPISRNHSLHDRSLYRLGVLERKLHYNMSYHLFELPLSPKLGSGNSHRRIEFGLQLPFICSLQG